MLYKIKYKRTNQWFWRTIKNVKGHNLIEGKLDIYLEEGIRSISNWKDCDIKLGLDFILVEKENMSKESGLVIK